MNGRKFLSLLLALSMVLSITSVGATAVADSAHPQYTPHTLAALAQGDDLDDAIVKADLRTMNMIHNNPGLEPYTSLYNDSQFLADRDIDDQVFFLYDCAQYGVLWDKYDREVRGITLTEEQWEADKEGTAADNAKKVLPYGSVERAWEEDKKAEITQKYDDAKAAGRNVSFMMDAIAVPKHLKDMYSAELTKDGNSGGGGTLDIKKPAMRTVVEYLFEEMFTEFPQIDSFTLRFGETYVGPKYGAGAPYHVGNNPIIDESYHKELIDCIGAIMYGDKMVDDKPRDLIYRNWVHGAFQNDPTTYRRITDPIAPNEHLYFCIKHTNADFARNTAFNPILGIGKHQQIVEVQSAREYEGKGAFPNYIAEGVINGFEEYGENTAKKDCLRDVINTDKTEAPVVGVWTWDRGGGWNGPYLTGVNGISEDNHYYDDNQGMKNGNPEVVIEDGSALWCDVNTYVVTQWAKDTSKTDKFYCKQYATDILGMTEEDAETFYKICILSARALLVGKNGERQKMNNYWMRDDILQSAGSLGGLVNNGGQQDKEEAVALYAEMLELANSLGDYLNDQPLPDSDVSVKSYIITTCQYGYYFFDLIRQLMYAQGYKAIGDKTGNYDVEAILTAVDNYDRIWEEWQHLFETAPGCPSPFYKEDKSRNLLGYSDNAGTDSFIKKCRPTLGAGKNVSVEVGQFADIGVNYTYGTKAQNFTLVSSDPDIADVDQNGNLVGKSEGVARIDVTTKYLREPLHAAFMLRVMPEDITPPPVTEEETVFEQTFETQAEADLWQAQTNNPGGSFTWSEDNKNVVIQGNPANGKCDYLLTMDEAVSGRLIFSADMLVTKKSNNSLTLLNSAGKILAQLDFGGMATDANGNLVLNGANGSKNKILLGNYEAETLYTVKLDIDTEVGTFVVSVKDEDGAEKVSQPEMVYTFREAGVSTDLKQLKLCCRDGAVVPPVTDSATTVDNIKIVQFTESAAESVSNLFTGGLETVFEEHFDTDTTAAWEKNGAGDKGSTVTYNAAEKTMTVSAPNVNGERVRCLPESYYGELVVSYKMKISNANDRGFIRVENAAASHINQVEFRGSANAPVGNIIVDWGTSDYPSLKNPYAADTWYTVTMNIDTTTQKQHFGVEGGSTHDHNGYKQNSGDAGVNRILIGTRGNGAVTIDDIVVQRKKGVDFTTQEVADTIKTIDFEGQKLMLPNMPMGYTVAVSDSSGVFNADGTLAGKPAAASDVAVTLTVTKTAGGTTANTAAINVRVPAWTAVESVTLDKANATLRTNAVFKTLQLKSTVLPIGASNQDVTWTSSNEGVAVVNGDGVVTAISAGTTTITATTVDESKSAECIVTVARLQPQVSDVVLSQRVATLNPANSESLQLTATVKPLNAKVTDVTWESSDANVATVDAGGLVTATGNGIAVISVHTVEGGYTAPCVVTVNDGTLDPVTSVSLNTTLANLYSNTDPRSVQLTATVSPENAITKRVTWTSSNRAIATVDANGLVTAKGNGTANITATTADGGFTATCTINVTTYNAPIDAPPSDTTTKTETNPDGSTTKTVTDKKTGEYTETTTYPDGTKIVTTSKDGLSRVTIPEGKTSVTITIPTDKKPTPGTVAVIVKSDGTEEIIRSSISTDEGMRVALTQNATLKLVDNTKTFGDMTGDHWASGAVTFVTSRELFNGTGTNSFSPKADMSRAMLVTVLARLDGHDTSAGEAWDTIGTAWAEDNGISDGTGMKSSITREQLAVMLYRYAKAEKTADTVLSEFPDAGAVSGWAVDAMSWAASNGILSGNGNGQLNPGGTASRAEVAIMLQRFVESRA